MTVSSSQGDPCTNPWHYEAKEDGSICPSCYTHRRSDVYTTSTTYSVGYLQAVGAHNFGNCYVCGELATHMYNVNVTATANAAPYLRPACPEHGLKIPLGPYSSLDTSGISFEWTSPEITRLEKALAAAEKNLVEEREACAKIVCYQCSMGTPITGSVNGTLMHPGNCGGAWTGQPCKHASTKCEADGIWKRDPRFKEKT